jgi:GT2 family glycosyltransferase
MSGIETRVAVVIVNYNAGDALTRCVESVLSQGRGMRVVIIDNASTDGSARSVNELFGRLDNVNVGFNEENLGFSRAVNQAANGLRDSPYPNLLLLNPDCELFPGALRTLADALENHPTAAMAGPSVVDRHGAPMRATFRRFPDPWRSFLTFSGLWRLGRRFSAFEGVEPMRDLPLEVTEAEALSGACMLVRKDAFFQLGGMDEAYGLHCEDLDLMYRMEQAGMQRLFVPGARVYHLQGLSSGSRPAWVHWQKHRGMQRFFNQHQADRYILPLRWLVTAGIWSRFLFTLPLELIRK